VPLELLRTLPGGRRPEKKLHERFKRIQVLGEWFRAEEVLLRYVREQAGGGPRAGRPLRRRAEPAFSRFPQNRAC